MKWSISNYCVTNYLPMWGRKYCEVNNYHFFNLKNIFLIELFCFHWSEIIFSTMLHSPLTSIFCQVCIHELHAAFETYFSVNDCFSCTIIYFTILWMHLIENWSWKVWGNFRTIIWNVSLAGYFNIWGMICRKSCTRPERKVKGIQSAKVSSSSYFYLTENNKNQRIYCYANYIVRYF